jgi:hypothetical protein
VNQETKKMYDTWDAALALCSVESVCLDLKKALADGSMLRGYTAKKIEDIELEKVQATEKELVASVFTLGVELSKLYDQLKEKA